MATVVIYPAGAGTYTEFPTVYPEGIKHYEALARDGVGYVGSGQASGAVIDTFTFEQTGLAGTISNVTISCTIYGRYAYSDSSTKTKVGGTWYDGSTHTVGYTTSTYTESYNTSPKTSILWTWAEINAIDAGVSLTAESAQYPAWEGTDTARLTDIYITVTYTPCLVKGNPAVGFYGVL